MMGADHEIDVPHNFHLPSQGTREMSADHFGVGEDLFEDFIGGSDHPSVKIPALIAFDLLDPLKNLLLRFFSEPPEIDQPVLETGIFQFAHGFNIEPVKKD